MCSAIERTDTTVKIEATVAVSCLSVLSNDQDVIKSLFVSCRVFALISRLVFCDIIDRYHCKN